MPSRSAPEPILLDDAAAAALLPPRPARGHKGTFGKLLVIAGSVDYAGAALLVCTAAGRAGAGLVTLATPESLQPLFAAKVVEATTLSLPEDDVEEVDPEEALARILDHDHDALVVGPGLRPSLSMTELIRGLLAPDEDGEPVPAVLDAEALRSLATVDGWAAEVAARCVLTPHVGEFLRLRAADGVRSREAWAISSSTTPAGSPRPATPPESGARWSCSRALARSSPTRRPDGCFALREPGAGHGRHGRRAGRHDRRAAGPGPGHVRGRAVGRLPACHGRRGGPCPPRRRGAAGVRPVPGTAAGPEAACGARAGRGGTAPAAGSVR